MGRHVRSIPRRRDQPVRGLFRNKRGLDWVLSAPIRKLNDSTRILEAEGDSTTQASSEPAR